MLSIVLRRSGEALAAVVVVSIAVFAMTEAAPGRFLSELRANPRVSPATIALLEERFDLNAPIHRRYASWAASALRGDFGYSALYQMPVADVLWPRVGSTVILSGTAIAIAWLFALPAGLWSGLRAGGAFDCAAAIGSSALLALPDVVAGVAVVWIAAWTGWFPVGGAQLSYEGIGARGSWSDALRPLVLPALALAAVTAPVIFRHTRTAVIEALESRAVTAARLHGVPNRTIALAHVLPLAAVPLVPLFALSAASLLSASLVIEVVVAWPGLGPLMLEAVLGRDLHVLVASALLSSILLVATTAGSDVLLCWVDPRVRSTRR